MKEFISNSSDPNMSFLCFFLPSKGVFHVQGSGFLGFRAPKGRGRSECQGLGVELG